MYQLLFFLFALWTTTVSAAIPRGDGSAAHPFASDARKTANVLFRTSEKVVSPLFSPGRVWQKYPGHFIETFGKFQLVRDLDARGRLLSLTVSKDMDDLYSVTHRYRGESDRIDTLTITSTGAPTVTINVSGPAGMADEFIYTVNGQNTHTYSRSRNTNGRLDGISAPGFSQSWTLDEMGRVDVLTTNGRNTDYSYDPVNGSLASAVSADAPRLYSFSNRGELEEQVLSGETLLMIADLNQSGATAAPSTSRASSRTAPQPQTATDNAGLSFTESGFWRNPTSQPVASFDACHRFPRS